MYIRAIKMIVHAFMIELDQPRLLISKKEKKKKEKRENLCTKSIETCSLVVSQILAEFHPERMTYKTLHN